MKNMSNSNMRWLANKAALAGLFVCLLGIGWSWTIGAWLLLALFVALLAIGFVLWLEWKNSENLDSRVYRPRYEQ